MWVVLTNLPITAAKSAARIQTGFWFVFYLFLLPMVELHVGIGFYRILVKWGFLDRPGRKIIKRKENLLTGIIIALRIFAFSKSFLPAPIPDALTIYLSGSLSPVLTAAAIAAPEIGRAHV